MDIKEYIESGIVERYVLGIAPEAEQRIFESLCKQYPELNEALKSFETALEARLIREAIPPSVALKEKIILSLKFTDPGILPSHHEENKTPVKKLNVWKLLTAACFLLLAINVCITYYISQKFTKLQVTNNDLKNKLNHPDYTDAITELRPIVERPSTKWSAMLQPANASHCMAHIYWDSVSTNTFLLIGNIPKPVSHKQFQLWAILDNQPVNLGIFDIKKEGQLIQMKNVRQAKKFIITIEKKGGSPTPTMEAMYAIGKP